MNWRRRLPESALALFVKRAVDTASRPCAITAVLAAGACIVTSCGGTGEGRGHGAAWERPVAERVPMVEREARVTVDSTTTLGGLLSLPSAALNAQGEVRSRVGAVLLISGSGPQDRDGARAELPGYTPWRDVRDVLVREGFAVLRLDDRGVGASSGAFAGATTYDFARDARAALAWLHSNPEVDGRRIALVGHSEGAVVALLTAVADGLPDSLRTPVRALVLLGAPSRTGREIAAWQRQQLVSSDMARWPASERGAVLADAEHRADSLAAIDPWMRAWFALDPRAVARTLGRTLGRTPQRTIPPMPVLVVHGDTDRQVPPEQADELAAVLRSAGVSPVEVQHVGDTDHLLLEDRDGDPQGYVRLADRRVRPAVLAAITRFLSVHLGTP